MRSSDHINIVSAIAYGQCALLREPLPHYLHDVGLLLGRDPAREDHIDLLPDLQEHLLEVLVVEDLKQGLTPHYKGDLLNAVVVK